MTATILDGKRVAADVLAGVSGRVGRLLHRHIEPCLNFLMLGSSPPAEVYATRLERLGARVGVKVVRHVLPEDASVNEFEGAVRCVNADPSTDGILIQMPLPDHLLPAQLSTLLEPRKDVDGITVESAGRLYLGLDGQVPSTAAAIVQILDWGGIDVMGKHAVVVGRSNVVGHPVTELLLQRDATVTVTHRQTRNLAAMTREAEILVVAAGEPRLVTREMVARGVVILDAGITVTESGVVGDVDFAACREVAAAITPVPGGIGPVTNAVLMRHVISSAEQRE